MIQPTENTTNARREALMKLAKHGTDEEVDAMGHTIHLGALIQAMANGADSAVSQMDDNSMSALAAGTFSHNEEQWFLLIAPSDAATTILSQMGMAQPTVQ